MKKTIFIIILFLMIAGPMQTFASPGYGLDLTCVPTNYANSNCNNKEDMYKRIAQLEKIVEQLQTNCQGSAGSSTPLYVEERLSIVEKKVSFLESTVKDLQESIMGGLRNILTFLIVKK